MTVEDSILMSGLSSYWSFNPSSFWAVRFSIGIMMAIIMTIMIMGIIELNKPLNSSDVSAESSDAGLFPW